MKARLLTVAWSLVSASAILAAPALLPNHSRYFPDEPIVIQFSDGPGNPADWVGIYPEGAEPGGPASTLWFYVNGTRTADVGLRQGSLNFAEGLSLGGVWNAYFLLNDGYDQLASTSFEIVDPSSTLVRTDRRTYSAGEPIVVSFFNGYGNPKDWIGIYRSEQSPGGPASTAYLYTDGTQSGTVSVPQGSVTFTAGLAAPGDYTVYFLLDDGYDILSSETITVLASSDNLPRIVSISPANGANNLPPQLAFTASITNGTSSVVPASVTLLLNDTSVPATVTQTDGLTQVSYTSPNLPAPNSTHTWTLAFQDNGNPPGSFGATNTFTIGAYRDIRLPNPIYFENFDAVTEGSLPPGWTEKSYTDQSISSPDEDFENLDSAAYARWTVVNADRFLGSFVTYSNPETLSTDYQRVLTPNLFNVLNGQVLDSPLAQGRFVFGNAGYRNGASQVLFLFTPDFNLVGRTNVHLSFKSLWEQNQDSIATIEYSVDRGTSWLPIAYFLHSADIVRDEDGNIDAITTFETEYGDVALYTDDEGTSIGGRYGAFLAAPISAELAPFIHGRVDDNPTESKRIELFPLPQADNQATVRFRFGHAGTDSWYFGIDDLGLYELGADTGPAPTLAVTVQANELVLTWSGSGTWILESTPALTAPNWQTVPGVTGSPARVSLSGDAGYFRLRQP
jgi:hypothetical protein